MSDKREKAEAYFLEGYNCAQSVMLAFCEETGLSVLEAARLMSSFGGGFGGMREVCGAVSGMCAVIGMLTGYDDPKQREQKAAQYADVRALSQAFTEQNGSLLCRELLEGIAVSKSAPPAPRTPAYYATRPCAKFVGDAAELTERYLSDHGVLPR